jgi:hypothetical protein
VNPVSRRDRRFGAVPLTRILIAGVIASIIVGVTFAVSLAGSPAPTKGPIPPNAWTANGVDKSLVPDYIPALDQAGNQVGYVSKDLAITNGAPPTQPIPVYASDLQTIVGYMYPGRGFVPLGTSPDAVPTIVVTTEGVSAGG